MLLTPFPCRNLRLRKEDELRRLENEAMQEVSSYKAQLLREVDEEKRRLQHSEAKDGQGSEGRANLDYGVSSITFFFCIFFSFCHLITDW